jgi:NAD(P)-dependent dehydrogenase (short-subunit alcohol dehydrogenase family)
MDDALGGLLSLEGKTAIVTGGSKGIGKAIAARFCEAGADVMLTSRKQEGLEQAAAEMPGPGKVEIYAANAGEPDQAAACVDATMARFGAVDILVNNAAANPYMGPTMGIDLPRYDKTFQVNLRGPLVWTQRCWEASMQERGGNIINVASIGGLSVETTIGIYNTTKAALLHLTRIWAAELSPGVRVNALAPGLVKTDFARALWEPNEDRLGRHTPLGRIGEPDDIGKAALFLASDMSSWMTGQVLIVDGGATIRATG